MPFFTPPARPLAGCYLQAMTFDFDAAVQAPFRMQPGLRRLAAGAAQLTPSVRPHRGHARHLREKLAVLGAFADQALCRTPGFDPAPALAALSAHASAAHPQAWADDGRKCRAPALGWGLDAQAQPHLLGGAAAASDWPEIGPLLQSLPADWRRSALLLLAFDEDFAIVDGRSAKLPWLAVALPSSWAPTEKLGRSFAQVHGPVADNRLLIGAADHLLRVVCGPEHWERFVWTLSPHPRLHAHPLRLDPAGWPAQLAGDALAANAWFRSERQTFIPVPGAGQAVFTIRVDVQPLAHSVDSPARARRLHDALASMSAAVLAYRGLAPVRDALLRWLADRAQGDRMVSPAP